MPLKFENAMAPSYSTLPGSVTALPLAVGRLHRLHRLPVLDAFFRLLRLSERAYKGHTAFNSPSSSFSLLMLDFLVDSYIVV